MTQITQTSTDYLLKEETDRIIAAFYAVYRELGFGFLEQVYQNALFFELQQHGFSCVPQQGIEVYYKERMVGKYVADIVVNDCIILELKATQLISAAHELQLINYLKATHMEVGLLLNFGESPQVKRKIYTNDRKKSLCSSVQSVSSVCQTTTKNNER